jgi:hypothetical protein
MWHDVRMLRNRNEQNLEYKNEKNVDRCIQILSLEYQALSAQITTRLLGRFQTVGFLIAAAAITASTIGEGHYHLRGGVWISVFLAASIFGLGLVGVWMQGRNIAAVASRIADIEARINELVPADPRLLNWELDLRQRRTFVKAVTGLSAPSRGRHPG